jgi:DNA-binding MarR family transcriptional regulator
MQQKAKSKKSTKSTKSKKKTSQTKKASAPAYYDNISYDNPATVHDSLKAHLGYLLHKATLIYKTFANKRLEKLGIQGYHLAALLVINAENNTNQIQICTSTGVDKATMVKTIDHLEKLKLVERIESKTDRRVKNLHLTKKGHEIIQKAEAIKKDSERLYLTCLGPGQDEVFKKMLLTVVKNLGAPETPSAK